MSDLETAFNTLNDLCRYGFTVEVNEYRQAHSTIEQWIKATSVNTDDLNKIKMIENKSMVEIYAYPRNTHTQLYVAHYDLTMAMNQMIVQIQSYLAEHPSSV